MTVFMFTDGTRSFAERSGTTGAPNGPYLIGRRVSYRRSFIRITAGRRSFLFIHFFLKKKCIIYTFVFRRPVRV